MYPTGKDLPTSQRIQLIDKRELDKVALDKNIKFFIVYSSFLSLECKMIIYLPKKAQIAMLLTKKVFIFAEYPIFANIFLKKSVKMFLE